MLLLVPDTSSAREWEVDVSVVGIVSGSSIDEPNSGDELDTINDIQRPGGPRAAEHPGGEQADMESESEPEEAAEACFAGGCLWGVESLPEDRKGVLDVTSGYVRSASCAGLAT